MSVHNDSSIYKQEQGGGGDALLLTNPWIEVFLIDNILHGISRTVHGFI